MGTPTRPRIKLDWLILLFLFAVFLIASPAVTWWASARHPWYSLYIIWFILILLVAWVYRRAGRNEL